MRPEPLSDAAKIPSLFGVLQVRCEETEASFEDLSRPGGSRACEYSRGDSALRRPTGMEKLGLSAIDPALKQPGREAAADARGLRHLMGVEPEDPRSQV